eukprot:scaffold1399_cov48-Cyclotella_meneghiniana.AAC.2
MLQHYYRLLIAATTAAAAAAQPTNQDDCSEFYLAPSRLKHVASHGFGLGIFTRRPIRQGEPLDRLNELLLPLYDASSLDVAHPPLREYLWPTVGTLPELAIHSADRTSSFWFAAGISAMAPCTSFNFNVENSAAGEMVGAPRWNLNEDRPNAVPLRSDHAAGSYSYRHNATYIASRDISAGEELVVDCFDDNFDDMSVFDERRINKFRSDDASYMCLDNVRSGESQIPGGVGMGLLAHRSIKRDDIVLSSPVVPLHRMDLIVDEKKGNSATPQQRINNYQLMMNYVLGHPDSDVLLLPYGPFVNFINHPPKGQRANAVIKWHEVGNEEMDAPRRMQFHHDELFQQYAKAVTETHGKGLVIDIVALNDIKEGEEIYIDYGERWVKAWNEHKKQWRAPIEASTYRTADRWYNNESLNPNPLVVRTVQEQMTNPYPDNLQTMCYYDADAKVVSVDEEHETVYTYWDDDSLPHECLRPCNILERITDSDYPTGYVYTVEMLHFEGEEKFWFCAIREGKHISNTVTYEGILILDKPYTHDIFLEQGFRHEIGVPDGLYPKEWMRSKIRRKDDSSSSAPRRRSDVGDEFRRKKVGEVLTKKQKMMQDNLKSSRSDL